MSIGDKIAEKIGGAFGWVIFKELRGIRQTLEIGVDSQREIHGLQPLFKAPKSAIDQQIEDEQAEAAAAGHAAYTSGVDQELSDAEPDFLRLELLEMLARDNQIMVTAETDLLALGKSRGWLDDNGQVTMLPKNYPS